MLSKVPTIRHSTRWCACTITSECNECSERDHIVNQSSTLKLKSLAIFLVTVIKLIQIEIRIIPQNVHFLTPYNMKGIFSGEFSDGRIIIDVSASCNLRHFIPSLRDVLQTLMVSVALSFLTGTPNCLDKYSAEHWKYNLA